MAGGLDVISSQLKTIEKDVKSEILQFDVGVSHAALDEERERNHQIRENLESFVATLSANNSQGKNENLENAKRLLRVAKGNTETLRYLESISCLESIFTDVAKAATVTAVDLSRQNAISPNVSSTRFLSDNVKHCWDYTTELSRLTALHVKAAGEYHQYKHDLNEIRNHAIHLQKTAERNVELFSPDGNLKEAIYLDEEMNEYFQAFLDLSKKSNHLRIQAKNIFPVEHRLLNVKNGKANDQTNENPIMVQLLMTYISGNQTIHKGECVQLLDTTENAYLWKVKTPDGFQYVPSIACMLVTSNESVFADIIELERSISNSWKAAIEHYRKQLTKFYIKYFQTMAKSTGIRVDDESRKMQFLNDLKDFLFHQNVEGSQLERLVVEVTNKMSLHRSLFDGVWNTTNLYTLNQPLFVLNKHILQLQNLEKSLLKPDYNKEDDLKFFDHNTQFLSSQIENLKTYYFYSKLPFNLPHTAINASCLFLELIQGVERCLFLNVLSKDGTNFPQILSKAILSYSLNMHWIKTGKLFFQIFRF